MYESEWFITAHLRLDLLMLAERSPWHGKAENNIEERVGMTNFSTIGRTATQDQRRVYKLWDDQTGERKKNAEWLSIKYPRLEFSIGGDISTDIHPKGKDKSQVLAQMTGHTVFFGDKCQEGGNDHSIAQGADQFHQVNGWEETRSVINSYL